MWGLARAGDDAARAFEQHRALQVVGQRLCRGQAFGLHLGGALAQQACGLQRVGGQDGGVAACPAGLHSVVQGLVTGQCIQCVGIQHQARRLFQHGRQPCVHGLPTAAAAHHGGMGQVAAGAVRIRQHQVGQWRVDAEFRGVQQVQQGAACAVVQGGAGGQDGGADHAWGAANHQHIAKAALVAVVPAPGLGCRAAEPGAGGLLLQPVGALQVVPPDVPAGVAPVGGEQPGFQGQQAQGVAAAGLPGLGGRVAGQPGAVVGVQARGQVDGDRMPGAGIAALQQLLQRCGVGITAGALAQAQQRVDDHIFGGQRRSGVERQPLYRCLPGLLPGGVGVVAASVWVAQPVHADFQSAPRQMAGCHQSVATVVARSAQHPGLVRLRRHGAGQVGDGLAGALHQAGVLGLGQRGLLDAAAGLRIPEGP